MILFISYLNFAFAIIKYDYGFYENFSPLTNFLCYNGSSQINQILFSGLFDNIPQVFIGLEYLDFDMGLGYQLKILEITKEKFSIQIDCLQIINAVKFYWYAIDDQRIQVINNFNMEPPANRTFPLENPNVNFGILSLTSLGMNGSIDFNISISNINATQVTVNVTQVNGKFDNLKQIGYQILLGNDEAFYQQFNTKLLSNYKSEVFQQNSNRWLFLAFTGFNMSSRLKEKVTRTSFSIQYTLETFDSLSFVSCNHQRSWIAYIFTKVYTAFQSQNIRLSQSYDKAVSLKPQFQIDYNGQAYNQLAINEILIEKSTTQLSLKVYVKCENSKKIQSQFLRCQDCLINQYHKFTHICNGQIDGITYFPIYQNTQQAYKLLTINIQTNKATIEQVLYNNVKENKIILDIQILNQ